MIIHMVDQLSWGFQQTSIIIVGNLIGANDVPLAKKMALTTFGQVCIVGGLVSSCLYAFGDDILLVFAANDDVSTEIARETMPLLAISNLILCTIFFLVGCTRALGLQAYDVLGFLLPSLFI